MVILSFLGMKWELSEVIVSVFLGNSIILAFDPWNVDPVPRVGLKSNTSLRFISLPVFEVKVGICA